MTRERLGTIAGLLGAALLVACLLEVGANVAYQLGQLQGVPPPTRHTDHYWWGDHPDLGVWRRPNARFDHVTSCFRVRYRTNSIGARDVERAADSERPRVVLLGDSFFDGWGVPEKQRLSNLLEAETGIEHLNFAMPHFGTHQELLAYRTLVRDRFRHDAIMIGVLPVNDFVDNDLDLAQRQRMYDYRYRPYLVGDEPPYRTVVVREPAWRRFLRRHSYAATALLRVAAIAGGPDPAEMADKGRSRPDSWFYDFAEPQVRKLAWTLGELAREADGRPVLVVLVPVASDYRRQRVSGPDPLEARLASIPGVQVVDLLRVMTGGDAGSARFFLPCDYHWSAEGNAAAHEAIRRAAPAFHERLGAPPFDASP